MKTALLFFLLIIGYPSVAQKKIGPLKAGSAIPPALPTIKYELKGIVTYFFNKNLGYKPDVGATAHIIKDGIIPRDSLDSGAAEAYRSISTIYSLTQDINKEGLPGEGSVSQQLKSARQRVARLKMRIKGNAATIASTADGQGVFFKKLKAGTYWVLIISEGRDAVSMQKVVIIDDDIEIAAKFGEYSL